MNVHQAAAKRKYHRERLFCEISNTGSHLEYSTLIKGVRLILRALNIMAP